ncbi:MAG: ATPase, T2SS/T4P/T4SS family [Acetatifactor sp.]|nr:ATPase, T2SS/T4P/T4SS family [Acetatifactor sp.]
MYTPYRYNRKKRLGEVLVESGYLTPDQIDDALAEQKKRNNGMKFGDLLIDMGLVTDGQIVTALCQQLGYEEVNLATFQVDEDILKLADEAVLRKHCLLPFGFSPKNPNLLMVAMKDPLDIRAVDDISFVTGYQIEIHVTTEQDITTAIERYYGNAAANRMAEQLSKELEDAAKNRMTSEEGNDDSIADAPIVKLVNQIIDTAVRKRTSDIHIEPMEDSLRIRYRVDGVLQQEMVQDISIHPAMISRIKIISGLDISEKRKPQDGRATAIVDRMEYDIRVSILPTVYGEKVVMRLTQKKGLTRDKKELGFPDEELAKFDKILSHPNGIILVTGPTGSGKSTTLYTALSELNVEGVNIITVEDPVEANIKGINQVQTNEKAGLTFASALRSILRQDPDIIMIGEIRDQETASIAVKAAITGHLVVSTLHTNSAASTITRLADMGVENYLIADSVVGIIAQRLVRRICPKCGIDSEATETEKIILGVENVSGPVKIKRAAVGGQCMHCGGNGYRGRVGVYEIMPITSKLRNLISAGTRADDIEAAALEEGMKTLRMAAAGYALQGITTIEEVKRITYSDDN